MTFARTTLLLFAVFISHPALAELPDRGCVVANGLRSPRANENCDYVEIIPTCYGNLAERLVRQPRNPAYLMPEGRQLEMPKRLKCHEDYSPKS